MRGRPGDPGCVRLSLPPFPLGLSHARPSIASLIAAFAVAVALLAGCGKFNRALKSTDLDLKLRTAQEFHDKGQFEKALPLLEELVSLTRGSSMSERVNYLHAKSYFGLKDYTMSGYYLNNFTRTFPTSQFAEECAFLTAYCHYKNSPSYELDQTDTRSAIDALQLFLIRYPTSALKDSCNTLIDVLRDKLEVKDFEGLKQYHKLRNYQAAGVAADQFLRTWPNSRFREQAMFLAAESAVLLADNSIESKREERLRAAIKSCDTFADAFPQAERTPDVKRMADACRTKLNASPQSAPTP